MYYMGGNFEETKVSDYLQPKEDMSDAMVQGMQMKIGVALSQDGISWGRVEGDDPSGACMVAYDKSDINQDTPEDKTVEEELYVGWPEVAVDVNSKSAFQMFYSTLTKDKKEKSIGWAVSTEGFRWEKMGVCLRPGTEGEDAGGCARCNIIKEAVYDEKTGEWANKVGGGWIMFYEGISKEDGKHRIMRAEREDGSTTWKKTGMVFDVGGDDTWDCDGVGSPNVLRMDDGSTRMYYTGAGPDQSTAIGVAKTFDIGGVAFEREQATFNFSEKEA